MRHSCRPLRDDLRRNTQPQNAHMRTAILLDPGFTALDAIGPYEAIGNLPGYEFVFVAEHAGPVSNGRAVVLEAGVSAGIDMGLVLCERTMGAQYAMATQLDMEYDPAPPFNAGHPRSAPPEVTTFLRSMYDAMLGA